MNLSLRLVCSGMLLLTIVGCGKDPAAALTGASRLATTPSAAPASVAARPIAHGFASLPDRGELIGYPRQPVKHDGAYTWHRTDLSEAHALNAIADGNLRVTTPSGETLVVRYDHHIEHASGDWTWVGHIPGQDGEQTILTFGAHAAFGSIAQPGKPPLRLTVRNGVSWLVETDPTKVAGIINAATRPQRPDYRIPPTSGVPDSPVPLASAPSMASAPVKAAATTATATTVDLVLGYTPAFASDNGGQSGAITRLNYLVDVTNAAYANSSINARVRLVATVPVSYPDNTSNDTTLDQLTGYDSSSNTTTSPNSAFSGLRAAREQYGADLVSMVRSFRDPENGGCGVGWLIGGGQQGISTSDSYYGYSVVSDGTDAGTDGHTYFCLDETLAHELGHNMGAQHDVDTAKGDDGVLNSGDYGAYAYSFGYKNATNAFYTIMAYGDSGQHIYRIFSDPRSTFCGGAVCGSSQADNAMTLTKTIPTVASFRATLVATGSAHNDVDGDGSSDLLFHQAATRQFSYRLMDGSTTLSAKTINGVGAGYSVAATGDFNGDGRTDMVWTSSARDLYLWLASGTGFVSTQVGTYPSGWTVVGAGDVDGDGMADLLFHNPSKREFSYRIMSGTATIRSRLISGVGAGYRVAAVGDFNGDGLSDIAWTSSALDVYIWLGNGTTFASIRSSGYPAGWSVAGAGDVDADGNDDLLFFNAGANEFSYRIMRGATVVRAALLNVGPGYHIAATGDFNGDRHLDIAWTSSALDIAMWLGNGTGFSAARAGSYPSGWTVVE